MLILGLDVGEKRIGVAKADSNVKIAIPVTTIEVNGGELQEIARLLRLYNTNMVVLGLPRSNEGNETAQSLYVRNFAKTLSEKVGNVKIKFQDESLTSVEAETRLKSRKKNYVKGDIDAEAASIILQDFIESFRERLEDTSKKTNLVEKTSKKVMLESKKATNKSKKFLKLLIVSPIILFLILVIAGAFIWYKVNLGGVTLHCADECPTIVVKEGVTTTDEIIKSLSANGLIRNDFAFKIYLKLERGDAVFRAGTYNFEDGHEYTAAEIVDIFNTISASDNVFSFTILPGETIFDVKKKLAAAGYEQAEIDEAFAEQKYEGYLFGDTHEFYKDESVKNILKTFRNEMDRVITENDLEAKYQAEGLSLEEGIILASIVQKEAHGADQPTVAQVFLLRKQYGIPLGSDVTVSYALDVVDPDRQIYKDNQAALRVDSCYNTRRYAGLPCGPISSPSLSALLAVANPSDTSYLYFLTGDDGTMYYSNTEAEHNQKIRDYCRVLCNVSL